ncbi:MAG: hypothetical protein PWQ67_2145 [Clostridia bacterium]|jgi:hypothetical protein|nr:hypothetical protein [Clostridia bacterium]
MIVSGLGVTCVYWLTLMEKDNYILKGAGLGATRNGPDFTAFYQK